MVEKSALAVRFTGRIVRPVGLFAQRAGRTHAGVNIDGSIPNLVLEVTTRLAS